MSDANNAAALNWEQILFLDAVKRGDTKTLASAIANPQTDVDFAEPETGMTPLHYAAAYNAIPLLKLLIASGRCDVRKKDRRGRTAATLAVEVADNPVLGRYLYDLEFHQSQREGPAAGTDAAPHRRAV